MEILVQPDSLSMVGSMNPFEIYTTKEVTFVLREKGSSSSPIVQHTYMPNGNNRVTLKVKDIISPLLSFKLVDASEPYEQTDILKEYEAIFSEVGGTESKAVDFSVIRAGVDKLADSAANFLKGNFLTWQPNIKPVTYYSPEFLTYYAQEDCVLMAEVNIWNGIGYENQKIAIVTMKAGKVWTVPMQYAIIKKMLANDVYPSYYDVWVEAVDGTRLTYVQRYYADSQKSEEEEWFLFENSLGGIDCFRAYGNSENTAEHTHNVAEIEEDSEEYRVDTTRKYKKSTGFLGKRERQWLLDFFPSLGKYRYAANSIRKITVTESDVNYEAKELPSNYTFTYKFSDARPYLNLSRTEGGFSEMQIHVPDLGNFTIAPRLAEFPRQGLSEGTLFPVQSPYSEEWGVTTLAAIFTQLVGHLSDAYEGGGGVGHQHKNFELLDALSDFMGYITYHGEKLKAGVADEADDFTENGKASAKILRKDIEDVAKAMIGFAKGAKFGDFASGLYDGKGARIDSKGNAEVESITVRSYMKVLELIVNRLSAIEDDQFFTESDTIEKVDYLGDGCYGLHLRSKYEGYFTAQHVNNVLKGIVNNLATAAIEGTDAAYYTSWMRVNSVNAASNYIEVTLYPGDEVPAGKNFPPCELMNIARWGNQTDESLQRCFYISSSEGRIVEHVGVTKPILENYNYGMVFGDLPDFLKTLGLPLVKDRPYLYAAGIVTQDIIQIDYRGKPIVTYVDRGQWSATAAYYCAALNETTGKYETSDVWHTGCKWRCQKTGIHTEPRWNNTDWAMIEGNPAFMVGFEEDDTLFDFDHFKAPLTIVATLYGQDITADILDNDVAWTRYTENSQGVQRIASDNIWAERRGNSGKAIVLTKDDLSIDSSGVPTKIIFTATVTLRDGMNNEIDQQSASVDFQS